MISMTKPLQELAKLTHYCKINHSLRRNLKKIYLCLEYHLRQKRVMKLKENYDDKSSNVEGEDDTVEGLKKQLETLMNSLAVLSSEKSRMEASFQIPLCSTTPYRAYIFGVLSLLAGAKSKTKGKLTFVLQDRRKSRGSNPSNWQTVRALSLELHGLATSSVLRGIFASYSFSRTFLELRDEQQQCSGCEARSVGGSRDNIDQQERAKEKRGYKLRYIAAGCTRCARIAAGLDQLARESRETSLRMHRSRSPPSESRLGHELYLPIADTFYDVDEIASHSVHVACGERLLRRCDVFLASLRAAQHACSRSEARLTSERACELSSACADQLCLLRRSRDSCAPPPRHVVRPPQSQHRSAEQRTPAGAAAAAAAPAFARLHDVAFQPVESRQGVHREYIPTPSKSNDACANLMDRRAICQCGSGSRCSRTSGMRGPQPEPFYQQAQLQLDRTKVTVTQPLPTSSSSTSSSSSSVCPASSSALIQQQQQQSQRHQRRYQQQQQPTGNGKEHESRLAKVKRVLLGRIVANHGAANNAGFGIDLDCVRLHNETGVPKLVQRLCSFCESRAFENPGLFEPAAIGAASSANRKLAERLRQSFERRGDADLESAAAGCPAVAPILLRQYLEELPRPLLGSSCLYKIGQLHAREYKSIESQWAARATPSLRPRIHYRRALQRPAEMGVRHAPPAQRRIGPEEPAPLLLSAAVL
ncbi:unnamed protein product [Trichogramma brassicae]|uniref:Rho-GAP domain-containing protein n=1 Tax=Trichogramma brassicae TaxID=86971 RepID=A0A6H5J6T2_9HYME|nr:unnamed protein product [Trichogramma brassicae]